MTGFVSRRYNVPIPVFLSQLPCQGCPVTSCPATVILSGTSLGGPLPAVPVSCLLAGCPGFPVLDVMFWPIYHRYSIKTALSCLSCPGCGDYSIMTCRRHRSCRHRAEEWRHVFVWRWRRSLSVSEQLENVNITVRVNFMLISPELNSLSGGENTHKLIIQNLIC
jgi:hypothetical protein